MSKTSREMFPKTLGPLPGSGIYCVQNPDDNTKWFTIFPEGEKSWTERLNKPFMAGMLKK